jgi:hypothetical protein
MHSADSSSKDVQAEDFLEEFLEGSEAEGDPFLEQSSVADLILDDAFQRFSEQLEDHYANDDLPKIGTCCTKNCLRGLCFFHPDIIGPMHAKLKHLKNEIDNPCMQVS